MTAAVRQPFIVRGRHVLFWVLGFFAVVIGLDALFVTWAVQTYPGEVSSKAYEDGLAYNRTLAERRAEQALGWTASVRQEGAPGAVGATFADAAGRPLERLRVEARFTRPATDDGAVVVAMRAGPDATYRAAPTLGAGAWDLEMTARDAQGHTFRATRRLIWR